MIVWNRSVLGWILRSYRVAWFAVLWSPAWNRIFKSITTDNGSEFADLSNLEQVSKTLVYYAHPYTFCNKGSVKGRIELIRRYIPKGDRMDKGSAEDIANIEVWCNSLSRKILNYKTPKECFDVELDHIYWRR
ncbi:hypothetical protein LA20531_01935 [Lactobacillus amylovorus DSM 20531]|nr:hypothetical protein LA20531_01935 [Lactobacillus amylovorus DSM 20531]KRK43005.1 hypothetical protein FC63_GL000474 [Lactobacillus amylovorus DSM 20531]